MQSPSHLNPPTSKQSSPGETANKLISHEKVANDTFHTIFESFDSEQCFVLVQLLTSPVLCKTAPATAWVERLSIYFEIQPEDSNGRARVAFRDPSTERSRSQETAKLDSLYLDARRKYKKLFGREVPSDSPAIHDAASTAQESQTCTPRKEKLKRTASALSSFGVDDENSASAATGGTSKSQHIKRSRLSRSARSLYREESLEVPYTVTVVASPVCNFHVAYSPSGMPAPHDVDTINPYFDPYTPYELSDLDSDDPIWVYHTEFVTVLSEDPEVNSDWRTDVVYGIENQIR